MAWDANRKVGAESQKTYAAKIYSGFMDKYLSGDKILEIGHRGSGEWETELGIVPKATGIDLGYPGYDGIHLPFSDNSQDAVYSSHCLEHITDFPTALQEWFRVLKPGGFLIIVVPHYQLYEKTFFLPSRFNDDHKRLYHPGILLMELHNSLPIGEWRLRHCQENDLGFDYTLPIDVHSTGSYEIECVIEKIPHYPYIDQMKELASLQERGWKERP
jgi:SAM-dependent methyltransferase